MGTITFGLILILLGLVFLWGMFAGYDAWDYIKTYWPTILIISGFFNLFDRKSSKLGNLILIAIGLALQIDRLDLLDFSVWKLFWPILLIILGISILIPNKSKSYTYYDRRSNGDPAEGNVDNEEEVLEYNDINNESYISKSTILFGSTIRNDSKSFKGGNISVILGGVDLDLRHAEIKENNAVLNVNVILGGLDIIVPDNWNVHIKTTHILGSADSYKRINKDPNAPVLTIIGTVILGGVDVK